MSPNQLHILQHSLGVDKYGQGKPYREHYCVGLDNAAMLADLRALVAQGWMREGHKINEGRDQYFYVTQLGLSAMKAHSPTAPKVSRGEQRYRDYLRSECSMSFGEYLKYMHANRDRLTEIGYAP